MERAGEAGFPFAELGHTFNHWILLPVSFVQFSLLVDFWLCKFPAEDSALTHVLIHTRAVDHNTGTNMQWRREAKMSALNNAMSKIQRLKRCTLKTHATEEEFCPSGDLYVRAVSLKGEIYDMVNFQPAYQNGK